MGIFLFGLIGCGDGKIATIEFSESSQAEVPGGGPLGALFSELGFDGFMDMSISESEELANQGVAPGDISSAEITNFTLSVLDPEGEDLSFINSLEIWVETEGIDPVMVASQTAFPEGSSSVEFNLEKVDIVAFVVSEKMTITTEVDGGLPAEDTTLEAVVDFAVGVTIQGALNASSKE